jgi:hypothetical protein
VGIGLVLGAKRVEPALHRTGRHRLSGYYFPGIPTGRTFTKTALILCPAHADGVSR